MCVGRHEQDGVPEAIENLADAGCKIWMLTGDREETAVNIGRSCRLLKDNMRIVFLNAEDREAFFQQLAIARGTLALCPPPRAVTDAVPLQRCCVSAACRWCSEPHE